MKRVRIRDQQGQVLPIMALFMLVVAALMVITVDFGRVYVAQQQLQNAVNAAALAAGQQMPDDSAAYTAAIKYGGTGTAGNAPFGYDVSTAAPIVTFECLSHGTDYTAGTPPTCPSDTSPGVTTATKCNPTGSTPANPSVSTCNAVYIKETATVKSIFGGLIFPSWTVSASAIAAAHAAGTKPLDVFVILDTSQSMQYICEESIDGTPSIPYVPMSGSTPASGPDKEECAKDGVQSLLEQLAPCASSVTCGTDPMPNIDGANWTTSTPVDEVGVMVTPANTSEWASYEDNCNSTPGTSDSSDDLYLPWSEPTGGSLGAIPAGDSTASVSGYTASGYEAVGLSSDYRNSASTTNTALNANSDLVKSVSSYSCSQPATPGGDYYGVKVIGGHGSYLAGAITYAEYALLSATRAGMATPVIVIESDGDLDSPTSDSSYWSQPGTSSSIGTSTSAAYYEAWWDPCLSAIEAADQAKAAGISIYSIEFDSADQACSDDSTTTTTNSHTGVVTVTTSGPTAEDDANAAAAIASASTSSGGISGFPAPSTSVPPSTTKTYGDVQTMEDMAGAANTVAGSTTTPYYYDDDNTGSDNPLASDFASVGVTLANARLIPACTNAPPAC
jgi:Flp pilus assembly protein TadG